MKFQLLAFATACIAAVTGFYPEAMAHLSNPTDSRENNSVFLMLCNRSPQSRLAKRARVDRKTCRIFIGNLYDIVSTKSLLVENKWFVGHKADRIRRSPATRNLQRIILSQEDESTVININSANLKRPYTITISAHPGTYFTGHITLNNQIVKTFAGNKATMNLSPCLSKGRHTIQVSANFRPATSSVEIELSGPETKVTQATGGNGTIRHTMIIDVR